MTSLPKNVINIETTAGEMPAHLWLPPGGSGPGLVMVQEIFGISSYIERRSADLAALGYVVLAPEIYWRLDDAEIDENADDSMERAMGVASRVDWDAAVADVRTALVALRRRPEVTGGTGLIGFCFGGGLAFNVAALEQPDVLVSYYGSSLPGLLDLAGDVTAPSLHHFGLADSFIPPEQVARIEAAVTQGSDVVFETYPGADHAFDNSALAMLHNPSASAAAWQKTQMFLAERLPVRSRAAGGA
jgi:carboxymethylenebutenolidase